jgi:ubiquinone/menaquinone biosynthesis C-methylase UbiE
MKLNILILSRVQVTPWAPTTSFPISLLYFYKCSLFLFVMSNYRDNFVPRITKDLEHWHKNLGELFFKKIGLKEGFHVLDFGCGSGTYTIPAAKVVGSTGIIFALDSEQIAIDEVLSRAKDLKITDRIKTIKTQGELIIPLANESVDMVLLYDVIGSIIKRPDGIKALKNLLEEIKRISKHGGKLSIIPKHLSMWHFSQKKVFEVINSLFILEKEEVVQHIHWDFLEEDIVYTFCKKD